MNEIKILEQRELLGREFTIYGTMQNPLFLAKDIADWIDYAYKDKGKGTRNTNMMLNTVDEDEKLVATIFTSGQNREMWFLTENGLYEVLFQSRKPIAKQFKKMVKQILNEIRKHGFSATPQKLEEIISNPDLLIGLATELKKERAEKQELQSKATAQAPKVLFADAVTASKSSILVGELAKLLKQNGIDIGQNRLFDWLRNNGYLISRKGTAYNMPTQRAMELKLFEIKETTITHSDGHISVNKTPKVTGKGQVYFLNKFLSIKEAV